MMRIDTLTNSYFNKKMEDTMILVVGSTGLVGSGICQRLAKLGKPFKAMVRESSDPAKVAHLKELGAQLVKGDLRNPASLKAACQGIDMLIETVSAMPFSYSPGENDIQHVDLEGSKALIDAAKAAGVKHLIYTSFSSNLEIDAPLCNAKRAVEKYLAASGMTYTILRPSCFMEVWLSPAVGFDAANAKASIYGKGDQPVSWIAIQDVIAFAVESLTNPAARNAFLELGGPEMVSPHQAVKIFEQVAGKPFELVYVPVEALKAQWECATDAMQKSFAGLMVCVAAGDPIDMKATLKAFPLKLTSVRDYARSVLVKA
jgi:uncharacterized protein YbjT (DUF2867 family)